MTGCGGRRLECKSAGLMWLCVICGTGSVVKVVLWKGKEVYACRVREVEG